LGAKYLQHFCFAPKRVPGSRHCEFGADVAALFRSIHHQIFTVTATWIPLSRGHWPSVSALPPILARFHSQLLLYQRQLDRANSWMESFLAVVDGRAGVIAAVHGHVCIREYLSVSMLPSLVILLPFRRVVSSPS
jgi:hypothetical protein